MDIEVKKAIDYLNYNISLEHSAIIQYLFHAYTIGEESIENELEEIAREEMKHLRMFAHAVVDLGGIPAIDKRASVFLEAPDAVELLQFDIDAEKMAIDEYSRQLKDISDKKVQKILERVINDETSHLHIFKDLQEKVKEKISNEGESSVIDENKLKIVNILNIYLQKQYEKILESLYQSFVTRHKNPRLSDELEQRAIDKMKHFGWVAEEIAEAGAKPNMDLPPVNKIEDEKEIVNYQIKDQQEFSKEVEDIAKKAEDKDLKWILERIAKREIHYTDLEEFLKKPDTTEKDIAKVISALTVGSLFKK
jgi:bacterioferritin